MTPAERKQEYDDLFNLMAEEFDYLVAHRAAMPRDNLFTISREDIARWQEFLRRINKLKAEAMS